MVCVSFCVICIVELLVSSVICRFQGLSYLHMPDCIRVFFYFVNSSHYSSYSDFCTKCSILDINLLWNMFFWSRTVWYETIELFILWHVWKCFGVLWVNSYQLAVHSRESCMIEQALLPHWLCNQKHHQGICSCSPIVNFFKFTFHHGMATSVIFLIKN